MYIYDIDNKFEWKKPSWTPDAEKYSEPFNRLLITGKSTMTPAEANALCIMYGKHTDISMMFENIEKKRFELIEEYKPIFERFKKNSKISNNKDYSDYIYYLKYIENENRSVGINQFAKDAFPLECFFILRI